MENTSKHQDLRQSFEYKRYMERIGWICEGEVFIRKIGPVAIAKIQRVERINWDEINRILKKYRVVISYYEPLVDDKSLKLRSMPFTASKTLRTDLLRPDFKKETRRIIRKLEGKYQIDVNNFAGFYEIWKKATKRKGLWTPNRKNFEALHNCFGEKCFCINIGDLAGAVILMHDKTAYYYFAAASEQGKKLNLPYLVVWEAMEKSRKLGAVCWDFEGIYDSRWPNKGWLGFTHFKKNFGGDEIEFPGAFKKYSLPF